jgi:UDP-3-O-[3-hydroxymyristoyl] glucosamine N-acyltransferase
VKLSELMMAVGEKLQVGMKNPQINGVNSIDQARAGDLIFITKQAQLQQLKSSQASACFCPLGSPFSSDLPVQMLPTTNPALAMARATAIFAHDHKVPMRTQPESQGEGCKVHPSVCFGDNVSVGDCVTLMPGVVLGDNVKVGSHTVLMPNVVVYHDCIVGSRCLVHAGSVIGSDGFGFVVDEDGQQVKFHHLGNVIVEDGVELGSQVAVDRGTFNSTIIGAGTKVDNLVHIAHNVTFGKGCIVCAQSGFAGSSTIGSRVTFGAQSGVSGHLMIADQNTFTARSGVTKTVRSMGRVFAGFPARLHTKWLKDNAVLRRLIDHSLMK